jgi:AraC family transcriptional regulator
MAYIHIHYAAPVSRSELAKHVGVNERYLTHCFHKVVGVPPLEYLNRYRVHVAKRLLLAGDKSIAQIAYEVGFGGGPQFSRVFRQYSGMSPREFVRSPHRA